MLNDKNVFCGFYYVRLSSPPPIDGRGGFLIELDFFVQKWQFLYTISGLSLTAYLKFIFNFFGVVKALHVSLQSI